MSVSPYPKELQIDASSRDDVTFIATAFGERVWGITVEKMAVPETDVRKQVPLHIGVERGRIRRIQTDIFVKVEAFDCAKVKLLRSYLICNAAIDRNGRAPCRQTKNADGARPDLVRDMVCGRSGSALRSGKNTKFQGLAHSYGRQAAPASASQALLELAILTPQNVARDARWQWFENSKFTIVWVRRWALHFRLQRSGYGTNASSPGHAVLACSGKQPCQPRPARNRTFKLQRSDSGALNRRISGVSY